MFREKIKKGFTLIELLIVLGIVAMLATMSVSGYSAYRKSVLLDLYAENIVSSFYEFQDKAILGEVVLDGEISNVRCYGFDFAGPQMRAVMAEFQGKKRWISEKQAFEYVGCDTTKLVDYPVGLELDPSFNVTSDFNGVLLFEPPKGLVKMSGGSSQKEIELVLQYGNSNSLADTKIIRYDVEKYKATILSGDENSSQNGEQ